MYKIPAEQHRTEETIKRSRFIATVAHAPTEQDAKAFISGIKSEFPDATHNCWAYVAGPPGDTARVGMSDDGEPHGTAGKPMLTVLLHSEIGEVVAVVTRYYGGTKLGTGGLVRAYSGSVKDALAGLAVTEKRDLVSVTVVFDYSRIAAVKKMMEAFSSEVIEENYEADVRFTIELPRDKKDGLIRAISDVTGGKALIKD
ncbi:MAG: YigZ family protein [bacterium]|jgi:uncharacterized YigZ family protein